MTSVSARRPPPNLDDSSSSESGEATPPPTPPPKPKPKKRKSLAFNPAYMTIEDGVVYEDRTRDNNRPLDPFVHLRSDDLQQLRRLLVDPGLLPKLAKSESKLRRVLDNFLYGLDFIVRFSFAPSLSLLFH